ncbi:HsdR family type I site-specific deoxyribonuclease [bacterium]|nr:HsdR family type I site-specific deoxyribonuclease [bacterium]
MESINTTPEFDELHLSKLPALHLLQNLGYTYIKPEEARRMRGGRTDQVLLEGVLTKWLQKNNRIEYKGKSHPFSEGNIHSAIQALKEPLIDGLVRTNEKIYDLLCLGKSFVQTIEGNTKSFTLNFIDWQNPENNIYHVTDEMSVLCEDNKSIFRPDIVLFVNGVPLSVIECKSSSIKDPMGEAISQHLRNQQGEGIQKLYVFSQILLSISVNQAMYGTVGTPKKFWGIWREADKGFEEDVAKKCEMALNKEQIDEIYGNAGWVAKEDEAPYGTVSRKVTEQDRLLYALCQPKRLLELTYQFMLYDGKDKKIARYQQYFCVYGMIERIKEYDEDGARRGGVVWHTQGSGKSLTMVYLAKAIALMGIDSDYKIILVTDRINLDGQIKKTFTDCGKTVARATTGKHLAELIQDRGRQIITTVIDKFESIVKNELIRNDSPDIFVLVDEAQRSQYKVRHVNMRQIFSKAAYIAFTGTPVVKREKNTMEKFGGIIDTYTMDQAVKDKSVVPLLYEGRHVIQEVDEETIDAWFERITDQLTKKQIADLKRKFSSANQINKTEQKIMQTAWDISIHFKETFKGTNQKGQLVTPGKSAALKYKSYLDEFGMVSSEVVISGPDDREGEEDIYGEHTDEIKVFWKRMMDIHGNEKKYNDNIINNFKNSKDPEIIIVVDKLLVGFDAPCNGVLYLTRTLKDHALLQAIARVNRLFEGKEYGLIIDYSGVLENLDQSLELYRALAEYDQDDLQDMIVDISKEIAKIPQKHSMLWDVFKEVPNKFDVGALEQHLGDEARRYCFYDRLSGYARLMSLAFSSLRFHQETPEEKIEIYKKDLVFFSKLRLSVRHRYSEVIDYGEYESKIQKLLDTHVKAGAIEKITPLVNIFNKEAFDQEVAKVSGEGAKADTIAHRTQRAINIHMDEDPVFYKRFSQLLQDAIAAFHSKRMGEREYLETMMRYKDAVINRTGDDIPEVIKNHDVAKAYFGVLKEVVDKVREIDSGIIAQLSLTIEHDIESNRIVNWGDNDDVKNRMRNAMEDSLFDFQDEQGLKVELDAIDDMMDKCIHIAKVQRP